MRALLSRLSLAGIVAALAACVSVSRNHPLPSGARDGSGAPAVPPPGTAVPGTAVPGQRATATSQPNASSKRVAGKEEPTTLIADDRSRCTVTAERFRQAAIGDAVLCDWRAGE